MPLSSPPSPTAPPSPLPSAAAAGPPPGMQGPGKDKDEILQKEIWRGEVPMEYVLADGEVPPNATAVGYFFFSMRGVRGVCV